MVFYGEYQVAFTSGDRLVLPKKIREVISGSVLVLTKGFDDCLAGFSKEDWEKRSVEFLQSSLISTENLGLRRQLFSKAVYIELDDQGRFVLPKSLLEFSNIKTKALFIGVGDHFEIWNIDRWSKYLKEAKNQVKTTN